MAYKADIPQATDIPANSQADLLANFTALNTIFGQDHVTFNAVADNGKHKQVTFQQQGAAPAVGATEKALYSLDAGGDPHLFLKNNGGSWDVSLVTSETAQITWRTLAEFAATAPLIFKSGNTNGSFCTASSAKTYSYDTAFTTTTMFVVITPLLNANSDVRLVLKSSTASGFTFYNPTATACDLMYFAIGR